MEHISRNTNYPHSSGASSKQTHNPNKKDPKSKDLFCFYEKSEYFFTKVNFNQNCRGMQHLAEFFPARGEKGSASALGLC